MDKKPMIATASLAQRELNLLVETGERVCELGAMTKVCWIIREEAVTNKKTMITASLPKSEG